jgi:hypothetical protein
LHFQHKNNQEGVTSDEAILHLAQRQTNSEDNNSSDFGSNRLGWAEDLSFTVIEREYQL